MKIITIICTIITMILSLLAVMYAMITANTTLFILGLSLSCIFAYFLCTDYVYFFIDKNGRTK